MDANAIFRTLRAGCGFNQAKAKKETSVFEKTPIDLERLKTSQLPTTSTDFFGSQNTAKSQKSPNMSFSLKRPLEISKVLKGDDSPNEEPEKKKKDKGKSKVIESSESDSSDSELIDVGEDEAISTAKLIFGKEVENEDKEQSPEAIADAQEKEAIGRFRNLNRIRVEGSDIPNPIDDFGLLKEKYSVKSFLLKNIELCKYTTPTPIQSQSLPVLIKGRDMIGIAPTGSGKTLAFLIPMLARLDKPSKESVRGLILSPTRELAQQIYRQACMLSSGSSFNISILTKANSKSFDTLRTKKCDILITTPLRLVALIQEQAIELNNVQYMTLDEADKLLEMGFLEQVDEIMAACSHATIQRCMFSATMPPQMEQLAKTILRNPVRLTIGVRNTTAETIKQKLIYVGQEEGKIVAIRQLIQEGMKPPVLIFVQSKERGQDLFHELIYENINVDVIHSDRAQAQREAVIKNFRMGKIWVLIATELVARGIDFKGVNLVINYDFPQSAVSYIHRIGRTGRAGRSGEAVTLFTDDDVPYLRMIAGLMRESGCDVADWMLTLKKPQKKEIKKLKTNPIQRKPVYEVPKFDVRQAWKEAKKAKKERKALQKAQEEDSQTQQEPQQQIQQQAQSAAQSKPQPSTNTLVSATVQTPKPKQNPSMKANPAPNSTRGEKQPNIEQKQSPKPIPTLTAPQKSIPLAAKDRSQVKPASEGQSKSVPTKSKTPLHQNGNSVQKQKTEPSMDAKQSQKKGHLKVQDKGFNEDISVD